MKNKSLISITIVFLITLFLGVHLKRNIDLVIKNEKKMLLAEFVFSSLSNEEGGILTNYIDSSNNGDITKGHFVLSESQGLILQYALKNNEYELFANTVNYIKENMILDSGLISWRVKEDFKEQCSASIDDLRIYKALVRGTMNYNHEAIQEFKDKLAQDIYKNLVVDDILFDFLDNYGRSKTITLCYLDLEAMKLLSQQDFRWNMVIEKSLELIANGKISNEVPLYKTYYDFSTLDYDKNENVDMLLSLITIKHLALVEKDVEESVNWIKRKFDNDNKIFSAYSSENGEVKSDVESTSIYACLVEIAKIVNDKELQEKAEKELQKFQILDKASPLYGAYGEKVGLEIYSFDNLNALIAL